MRCSSVVEATPQRTGDDMAEKGIGSKILGIFVETSAESEEEEPSSAESAGRSPAEIVAELAQASASSSGSAPAAAGPGAPPTRALEEAIASSVAPTDFDSIFKDAGLDAAELDRVKKAEELLEALPEATPLQVKRQIVEASLKAFGFDTAKILAAAQMQQKALDTYVRVNEVGTAKAIEQAQAQIAALNDQIASLRADIEKRTAALASIAGAAKARKQEVQRVLDFFGAPLQPGPKP
jgi:hypothetical protein